jgi:hypothetical protein
MKGRCSSGVPNLYVYEVYIYVSDYEPVNFNVNKREKEKKRKKNWMEGIRKAMNERNLNEGQ